MPRTPADTTRERILVTAEQLFAQFGYAGVSLRQITGEAKVNVAAINYHFFDKEGVYRNVVARLLQQINQHRLSLAMMQSYSMTRYKYGL